MTTLTYSSNGGIGTPSVATATYQDGAMALIAGYGSLAKEGYEFAYWNLSADGTGACYNVGDTLLIGSTDVTLYALWHLKLTNPAKGAKLIGSFTHKPVVPLVIYDPETVVLTTDNGATGVSISSGLLLLSTTSPDPITGSLVISTLDGSDLPLFNITMSNNVGGAISDELVSISPDSAVLSFTYTPNLAVSAKFTAKATLTFASLGLSKDVGLFAQASQPTSDIQVLSTNIAFGSVVSPLLTIEPLTISGIYDTSLISVVKISGSDDFLINLTDAHPNTYGDIVFGVAFVPTSSVEETAVWQLQYAGVNIGSPITLSATCPTYTAPSASKAANIVAAPTSSSDITVCFTNNSTSYIRVEAINVENGSTGEFQLLNPEIALGHVLKPYANVWFLLRYVPKSSSYVYPRVSVGGTYF